MQLFLDALQQTLIFLPLTLGIYVSYRVLNVTDLTVDGSFVLGAAIFGRLVTHHQPHLLAIVLGLGAGALAGVGVSIMQRVAKINSLIASIIAVFMLQSINFGAMGQPNINLLDSHSYLSVLQESHPTMLWVVLIGFSVGLIALMTVLLRSRFGLLLRAFGSNSRLVKTLGKKPFLYLVFGLALGNMLAALCGIMTAQINGYADVNMGIGMALTAIGAVVIGLQLSHMIFKKSKHYNAVFEMVSCVLGAYLYFLLMHAFLKFGIDPIYLKLVLGLVLIVFLSTAYYSRARGVSDEALG